MNDNIEAFAPILLKKARQVRQGMTINREEASDLLIKADLLKAHYLLKREMIEQTFNDELGVIDLQIELVDSFHKTFSGCIKC